MAYVETPEGAFEALAVVEPTVAPSVIMAPYGMGRWADTIVVKPKYFEVKDPALAKLITELPERVEIPEDSVNPVSGLPELVKKILFTKSPAEYYKKGLAPDKWRFNGVTPNVVQLGLAWKLAFAVVAGAAQAYFDTPAKIVKTGKKHNFEVPYIVW